MIGFGTGDDVTQIYGYCSIYTVRGHFQTIFNVIITLGGRRVGAVMSTSYTSLNAWFLCRFLMLMSFSCDVKGGEGG